MSANLPPPLCRIEIYDGSNTIVPASDSGGTTDVPELSVTLPILSRAVGGAKFKIQNFNSAYTDLFAENDKLAIWLYRLGASKKQVFGGRIDKLTFEGIPGAPEYYIYVEAMDYGNQMQTAPNLVQKHYVNQNGKVILTDAISLCPDLGTSGVDPNNQIASTHTKDYNEVDPWSVVKEMLDTVETSQGVAGFDGYVDPTGNVHVFPRGANTSAVSLTDLIINYTRDSDLYRVKNRQKVYGAANQLFPANMDSWTDSTTGWVVGQTDTGPTADTTYKKIGNCSILSQSASVYVPGCLLKFALPSSFSCTTRGFGRINYWRGLRGVASGGTVYPTDFYVLLMTDANNYFQKHLDLTSLGPIGSSPKWYWDNWDLGPAYETGNVPWTETGTPDWSNINYLQFQLNANVHPQGAVQGYVMLNIDQLFFSNGHFFAIANDTNSQSLYGVRTAKPVDDTTLQSNAECQNEANGIISLYSTKVITWKITTFGNNGFNPGDMQPVVIANDGINESFRITEIQHNLKDVYWETQLI